MTLKMGGKEYDVLNSSFAFNRSVDAKGRPSSGVYGGEIHFTLEAYEDTTLAEIMLMKQNTPQSATLSFDQGTNDGKMKEITITDGYIIAYSESASAHSSDAMTINMTITAREIKVGDNAVHTNTWPENKA